MSENFEQMQPANTPVPLQGENVSGQIEAQAISAPAESSPLTWAPPYPDNLPERPYREPGELHGDAFERSLDEPAHSPEDYTLPRMIEGDTVSAQDFEALRGIQSILWHGDFPVNSGNRLMHIISTEAQRVGDDMDDDAFEMQCRETDATLDRLYGAERHKELRAKLSGFLQDIAKKTPEGLDALLDTYAHVLATPMVMNELLSHVDRLEVRRRKR